MAEKLKKAGALAYYEETFDKYIFSLDMIIKNFIAPLEQKLTEGEQYHANEGDDPREVS